VSILIFGGSGVGRCFGCCPGKKVSMMRIRLPQQGQVCSCAFDTSILKTGCLARYTRSLPADSARDRARSRLLRKRFSAMAQGRRSAMCFTVSFGG